MAICSGLFDKNLSIQMNRNMSYLLVDLYLVLNSLVT
ncbi:MAG: hypothetical protein ACJAS1_007494 [Oleiphilaceae bacterium]